MRGTVVKNAVVRPISRDAPQKDVDGSTEMGCIVITGQSQRQQPVQGQGVEVVLKNVGVLSHGVTKCGLVVVIRPIAQVVGFPVDNVVASGVLKDHVNESVQKAPRLMNLKHGQDFMEISVQFLGQQSGKNLA